MAGHTPPFPAEALDENRSGRLTADQARRFDLMVKRRRAGTRRMAVPFAAIGAVLLLLSGPGATTVKRHLMGWGFVAVAAMFLVAPVFDPLAADARARRVETVEGAIGKRRRQSVSKTTLARYYLLVAGRELRTYFSAYDAAPDAGYVRAFYLPRTRRLVNLERLPNPPLPSNPEEVRQMFGRIGAAVLSGDRVASAEARASAAGLIDAGRSMIERSDSPDGAAAGGLVRSALVGTWTHPLATITLSDDGTATISTIAGAGKTGHWSVDAEGRLVTDASGTMAPMDATLDGDRLTVRLDRGRLTLTRAARG